MHFRLDDIHGAGARIHAAAIRADIVERDQARDQRIHNAFRNLAAAIKGDGGLVIRWTDIADQHQRTAGKRCRRTLGVKEFDIGVELAGEGLAALGDLFRQITLHQAEPVAIDANLVFGIDGGNGILAVHIVVIADST